MSSLGRHQFVSGTMKIKDKSLHYEFIGKIKLVFLYEYPTRIDCDVETKWEELFADLQQAKDLVFKTKTENGKYILHYAVEAFAPEKITRFIIDKNPKAVQTKDDYGNYPLHFACNGTGRYESDDERVDLDVGRYENDSLVYKLLKMYPQAATEKNQRGDYPLHIAGCMNYLSPFILVKLLKTFPQAAGEKNDEGDYPLHLRLLFNGDLYEEQETIFNNYKNYQNEDFISLLIAYYPQALGEPNRWRDLPFQIAIMLEWDDCLVYEMLDAFPGAVNNLDSLIYQFPNCHGLKTPDIPSNRDVINATKALRDKFPNIKDDTIHKILVAAGIMDYIDLTNDE